MVESHKYKVIPHGVIICSSRACLYPYSLYPTLLSYHV